MEERVVSRLVSTGSREIKNELAGYMIGHKITGVKPSVDFAGNIEAIEIRLDNGTTFYFDPEVEHDRLFITFVSP